MARKCCVCGDTFHSSFEGKDYCSKHYSQMRRHGRTFDRTIFDKNEYIQEGSITRLITFNKKCEPSGEVLVDTEDVERLKEHKWYIRVHKSKLYCFGHFDRKKVQMTKFLLNTDKIVDHINGNSLDNRKSNLREVTYAQNNRNQHRGKRFSGIIKTAYRRDKPYMAFIRCDSKEKYLGSFETYEDAVLARLKAEEQYWGEYGVHADLYYILSHPSPMEELKKVLSEGA